METAGQDNKRPVVVDFLVTLFITFCIGVAASLALVGSVLLIAGEARGEERCAGAAREDAPGEAMLARVGELTLAHHLAARYANVVPVERVPAAPRGGGQGSATVADGMRAALSGPQRPGLAKAATLGFALEGQVAVVIVDSIVWGERHIYCCLFPQDHRTHE